MQLYNIDLVQIKNIILTAKCTENKFVSKLRSSFDNLDFTNYNNYDGINNFYNLCPICSYTRFVTPVALSQHLINNHKDSFVDFSGDVEIEKLNSGKDGGEVDIFLKEKINRDDALVDEKVKYEVSPASHTARLSYRDVLVKGSVNENAANTSPINYEEGFKLYFEAAEAISTLMEERKDEIDDDYDYDSDNYDNVPEVPKGHLTEEEEDKLFWETICDVCKGTEAVTMMRKARKMLGMPI
ncbi:hypothetical protein RhiirA1_393771 [Rhizophagus irregularis]|uniref:C2H2-type domain-containing protein n=1 Tax=Rhizophagus irregularis TaxID=588596 RepID=A0A2N0RVQ7_9GLOM|nr:hypothetical protein RhiirA1_393771 [Rhizophagus irregularis]